MSPAPHSPPAFRCDSPPGAGGDGSAVSWPAGAAKNPLVLPNPQGYNRSAFPAARRRIHRHPPAAVTPPTEPPRNP
jgi:hypothetical protein